MKSHLLSCTTSPACSGAGYSSERLRPEQRTGNGIFEHLVKSEFQLTQIPPFSLVLEKGRQVEQVGYICKGFIDLMDSGGNVHTAKKGRLGKGDFFGLELFMGAGAALCDAFTLEPVECYLIDAARLLNLIKDISGVKFELEEALAETMKRVVPFSLAGEALGRNKASTDAPPGTEGRFDSVITHINTHYMKDLTLDEIARKAGLSRFYFSRTFKRETGRSFKAYLNAARMEAAKKLLTIPEMNVSQACYAVGFNDVSYFARIFKRYVGKTPSEFRRQADQQGH